MFEAKRRILVASVHADDETLGCSGTLLKHANIGCETNWIIFTSPLKKEEYKIRELEINRVNRKYNFRKYFKLNYPTTKLDTIPKLELVEKIGAIINETKPEIVFLPNRSDVHSDHQIGFDAVFSSTKNFRAPFIERILMYETLSETEFAPPFSENAFQPNVFVDISEYMDKKIEIMKIYESEVMPDNLPRSISALKALGAYRGSRIGVPYAEAFMLLFEKL